MTSLPRPMRAALAAIVLLACPVSGFAQGKGDGPPPAADPAKIEEAKKHMAAGAALYNDPSGRKCEEAYVEFSKAYELSGSLNALKNRAVCALELEKDGEALADYKMVLAGIGDKMPPDEKAQVEKDITTLESAVAWVTLKADKPGVKLLDLRTPSRGLPVRNRYEIGTTAVKIGLHPGDHTITATREDGSEVIWKITLTNGSNNTHTFELTKVDAVPSASATGTATAAPTGTATSAPPETSGSRPTPTSVKVMLGVTGALAVGTGVMMGLASVSKSDYDKANGSETDLAGLQAKRDTVVRMNGISDGLLGGTVLAAGTTLILYLIRPTVMASEAPKSGFFIAPAVTPSAAGAVVGGRF